MSENNESETTYTSTLFPGFSPIRPFGSRERDPERPWLELDGHVVPGKKNDSEGGVLCLVCSQCSRNDRKSKIDLLTLLQLNRTISTLKSKLLEEE